MMLTDIQRQLKQLAVLCQHLEQLCPVPQHPAPPALRIYSPIEQLRSTGRADTSRFDMALYEWVDRVQPQVRVVPIRVAEIL
jgi:hypothetical protein